MISIICLRVFSCSNLSIFIIIIWNSLSSNSWILINLFGVSYWEFTIFLWWYHVFLILHSLHSLVLVLAPLRKQLFLSDFIEWLWWRKTIFGWEHDEVCCYPWSNGAGHQVRGYVAVLNRGGHDVLITQANGSITPITVCSQLSATVISSGCKGCWGPQLHFQVHQLRTRAGTGGGWSSWYAYPQLWEPAAGVCNSWGSCRYTCISGARTNSKDQGQLWAH